jgi:hypothetical protein
MNLGKDVPILLGIVAVAASIIGGSWMIARATHEQARATRQKAFAIFCTSPYTMRNGDLWSDCEVEMIRVQIEIKMAR